MNDPLEKVRAALNSQDNLAAVQNALTLGRQPEKQEEDSYYKVIGKSVLSANLDLAANIGKSINFAQRMIGKVLGVDTKALEQAGTEDTSLVPKRLIDSIEDYSQAIAPNTGDNTGKKVASVASGLLGTLPGYSKAFQAGSAVSNVAMKGLGKVSPKLATTIMERIAKTGLAAEKAIGGKTGKVIGNTIANAPQSLIAGTAASAITNAEDFASPTGAATTLALSAIGGTHQATKNLPKPKTTTGDGSILKKIALDPAAEVLDEFDDLTMEATRKLIDRTAPLKRVEAELTGVPLDKITGQNLHGAQQMTNGSGGMVDNFFFSGRIPQIQNPDGSVSAINVKPLQDIFKPLTASTDIGDLREYLIAKRVLDPKFANSKIETGVDFEEARRRVANVPDHVKAAADDVFNWVKGVREYGMNLGLLDKGTAAQFDLDNPNYIPFWRSLSEHFDPDYRTGKLGKSWNVLKQRMTGSKKDIIDPIENLKEFANVVIKAADRNYVGQRLLDIVQDNPERAKEMGYEIIRASDKFHSSAFQKVADAIYETAQKEGNYLVDKNQASKFAAQFGRAFDPEGNTLGIWRDGKLHVMKVGKDVADVYKSMSPSEMNIFTELMGMPARFLRAGVTNNPAFAALSMLRDSWSATLRSQNGFRLGVDTFQGFKDYLTNPETRSQLARGFANQHSLMGRFRDNDPFRSVLPKTKGQVAKDVLAHPLQALRHILQPFEEAARMGEGMRALNLGAKAADASLDMRNISNDYAQIGASMQALSKMTAFLNPGIQSIRNDLKTLKDNPTKAITKGAASITLPSMMLWYANRNDQEIQNLRRTDAGQDKWYIRMPFGDQEIVTLAKPWFFGHLFGTSIENTLDQMFTADPAGFDRTIGGFLKHMSLNALPTVVNTAFNVRNNEDSFGNPIIPRGLEDVAPEFQKNAYTTALASVISNITGNAISPMQTDFIIRNTFGDAGSGVAKELDKFLRLDGIEPPTKEMADYPFLKRFFARRNTTNVEPVQTFYKLADKVNEVVKTSALLEKQGRYDEMNNYIDANRDLYDVAGSVSSMQKEIRDLRVSMQEIQNMTSDRISPEEKRRQLDYYTQNIISITQDFNSYVMEAYGIK